MSPEELSSNFFNEYSATVPMVAATNIQDARGMIVSSIHCSGIFSYRE